MMNKPSMCHWKRLLNVIFQMKNPLFFFAYIFFTKYVNFLIDIGVSCSIDKTKKIIFFLRKNWRTFTAGTKKKRVYLIGL